MSTVQHRNRPGGYTSMKSFAEKSRSSVTSSASSVITQLAGVRAIGYLDPPRLQGDVKGPVRGYITGVAVIAVVQQNAVEQDVGLAAVVHDVVVIKNARNPATARIQGEVQLGGILPRSTNGHPGFGSNASVRSNDDLATARKENTRPLAGAAEHPAVHRDALSAVTVIAHFGSAIHGVRVEPAHLNTACIHVAGEDRSTVDKDVDGSGRTHNTQLTAQDAYLSL